jgi:hypothetical protein
MISIEIKTSPFRLISRRAFRHAVLNRGKQLYTSGLGLSIEERHGPVIDLLPQSASCDHRVLNDGGRGRQRDRHDPD